MKRRQIIGLLGLGPLALISSKIPIYDNPLVENLVKRWKSSKEYTMAVFNSMPADLIEYAPTTEQMSFAQHFMHLGLINNFYFGILTDEKTYKNFSELIAADFLVERPDEINLFQPDMLQTRNPATNKALVSKYVATTFDYVITSLGSVEDEALSRGVHTVKPDFLSGHSNLDLILRGENHTAHHRAQAVAYLRMAGVRPPKYTPYNKF